DPPRHRVGHPDVVHRGDLPGLVEVVAAVERAGQEEHALAGLDVGTFPDDVDHARAVSPDGAALPPAGLGVVGGGAELALAPGAATVGRGVEHDGLGDRVGAAEGDVAQVDVAEERARGRVVGPDVVLVGQQRSVLFAGDHRVHPGTL